MISAPPCFKLLFAFLVVQPHSSGEPGVGGVRDKGGGEVGLIFLGRSGSSHNEGTRKGYRGDKKWE